MEDLTLLSDDSTKTGSVKSAGNFTFIRIHAAGHMVSRSDSTTVMVHANLLSQVPYNQPEASLDFLNRWIGGEWVEN